MSTRTKGDVSFGPFSLTHELGKRGSTESAKLSGANIRTRQAQWIPRLNDDWNEILATHEAVCEEPEEEE